MMFNDKEKRENLSPTTVNKSPAKDFIFMLFVILTTPIIFLYSFFTGKIRSPLLVVGLVMLIPVGFYYMSKSGGVAQDIKTKILHQTLEELSQEEKEKMRKKISTINKEISSEKVPLALHPLLDVPIDMLNINYFIFMIQSGYIKPSGAGSEFILNSYLMSNHKLLKERSWESLQNIKTEEARKILDNYEQEIAKRNKEIKRRYGNRPQPANKVDAIMDDAKFNLKDSLQKLRVMEGF